MELPDIVTRVFGKDYSQGSVNKIKCTNSKKMFLLDTREWLDQYLNDLRFSVREEQEDNDEEVREDMNEDKRPGRIGNASVYFTLDRSFGIIAINQEGLNVVAACRFATIAASCGVYSGKWMYELHLATKGIMQLGWCSNLCRFSIDKGCGDTLNSYAYDGSRLRIWNMQSHDYGELWKSGDVIGLCIDLDENIIEFARNGKRMGVAFENITTGSGIVYIPCVSLVEGETVFANFGIRPFRYPIKGFEPLEKRPDGRLRQAEHLIKYCKNLTHILTPNEPMILRCDMNGDISDQQFWNRFFSIICYHMNTLLASRYCLFSHFLPFVYDLAELDKDKPNLDKFKIIMDELWMCVKEKQMEKTLQFIFNYLSNNFKEVSQTLNCPDKDKILKLCMAFFSHETTRKFLIKNFIFERLELFVFLHQKPLDEQSLNTLVGAPWWDTKNEIAEIEKNKSSFKSAFRKIEKSYSILEMKQCKLLKLLLDNTDGNEYEPSSRILFLKKFRKFCWHELECTRNDINSQLASSLAYAGFLRLTKVLRELWHKEVGDEPLEIPSRYFYDHTFRYSNCDRIGGLEHFLVHMMHSELVLELGENHRIFSPEERQGTHLPFTDLRSIGAVTELMNLMEENDESIIEQFFIPTTTSGPTLQALFVPLLKDLQTDSRTGNADPKLSLQELYEDIVVFFMASVTKHCKKIARAHANFMQSIFDYKTMYATQNPKHRRNSKIVDDSLLSTLKTINNLQKNDLEKRARKNAWIESVLVTAKHLDQFVFIFDTLMTTVIEVESHGELFVFLPDFYLDACDSFTEMIVKDFHSIVSIDSNEDVRNLLIRVAELMIYLLGDQRIKHIDCKRIPINVLSTLAGNSECMRILESVHKERSVEFVEKLLKPYNDRHWKASNWILVRFWHGNGFGFRYTSLPHYNVVNENIKNPLNFALSNIDCSPSKFYQKLIKSRLMNSSASIPMLLDSMISELHWIFGEFLAPMQELQRAIERNEQLLMMGRFYKMCSAYFDKTIALLRVLDMFISLAPQVFLESYYPESMSLTKRIIQIVLLIIHRISSKQSCFRVVLNSRIAVLENVDYFPIQSACVALLIGILNPELEDFHYDNLSVPLFSRMVLHDPSFDLDHLSNLIGTPSNKNATIVSLHDYENELTESELVNARKLLKMLSTYYPLLSSIKVIPDDELCTICYMAPFDVKFVPCGHNSCLSCISYYLSRNRLCFFCKQQIIQVVKIENDEVIESLTLNLSLD